MGRSSKTEMERKLAFLEKMKEKRGTLFGRFSSRIENEDKVRAWKEMLAQAKSLALVNEDRDYLFLRDRIFGTWKSRALKKRDNSRRTGTGGGRSNVPNEVDLLVLEIVGTDSPVVDGMPIGESGNFEEIRIRNPVLLDYGDEDDTPPYASRLQSSQRTSPTSPIVSALPSTNSAAASRTGEPSTSTSDPTPVRPASSSDPSASTQQRTTTRTVQFPIPVRPKNSIMNQKEKLLMDKWKAQTELTNQQAYNLKLQNYRLENELGIPHGELTESLANV